MFPFLYFPLDVFVCATLLALSMTGKKKKKMDSLVAYVDTELLVHSCTENEMENKMGGENSIIYENKVVEDISIAQI